ncbi:MAG: MMPL family transporter [Methylococcales bacterium]|nr:MMPL family transporter [Methylococcales bacterium]
MKHLNWQSTLFYLLPPLLALCTVIGVDFKTDLSAFIIAGDNAEEILLASEMQSGTLSRRYLISVGSVDQPEVSKTFVQALQNQLNAIEGVEDVWLPGQKSNIPKTMQDLYAQYAAAMHSLNPEPDLESLFTEQGLQQRAALLKKLLLSPQGAMFKQIALQDPLLLTLNGFQSIAGQMQQVLSQDGHYQNLVLETAMAGLDAPQQSRIQTAIKQVFNTLNQQSLYQLEMTGVPIFAVATQTLIQGDITKVSILSSVALVLLFLLIFRSFSVSFQVFTLLAIVILSAILSTYLVFGYVHGMTVAIGSTLVGICIDYPIHAVAHAQSVDSSVRRVAVIAKIWPSMLLGGITTMIGYVALGASGYPGFQQVAVYAATGILVSLLLTRFIFPGLLTSNNYHQLKIPLIASWAVFCQRFRPWLITLLLMVLGVSMLGLKSLHWMKDMQELTPELDYLKQNDKRIRARMTSIEPGRFVLVTGQTIEAALQKTEAVYPVLDQLKQKGQLSDYFGLYPWLLSARQQQHNQTLLQTYLTTDNQSLWQQVLKQQGLSVKRLGDLVYAPTESLLLDQVLNTSVKKIIDSRIIKGKQQTIIMIWLGEHQPKVVQKAMDEIDGVQYFSQRDMLNNMTKDYTDRAQILLMIGMTLIILLLIVRYKSLFKAIQTLLPAVLSAFLILAVWSFTGVAISFLHLVGFLLVVAICVDYGIFYQENRGGDISLTYQAMAASMLTSALAFGSLITAESTSLRILASVVAVGVLLGFVLCPLIIKVEQT